MFHLTSITTNDLILSITAFIVLIYTLVTLFLWRQSVIQTEISLMPIPVIYLRKGKDSLKKICRIRNLGYGPMLNIHIDDFNFSTDKKSSRLTLELPPPNILKTNEERDLIVKSYIDSNLQSNFDLSVHLDPEFANLYIPLNIYFEDIRGIKYIVTIAMGTGKLKILKPVSRIKNKCKIMKRIKFILKNLKKN